MQWEKLGQVWAPTGDLPWAKSHATLPVVHAVSENLWFAYIGCRDADGKNRIARIELDPSPLPHRLPRVLRVDPNPALSLGEPGTFDDSGVMPSWLVHDGAALRMYYVGWNIIGTVPYRLSMGVAISDDNGLTFRRHSHGPIIDRSVVEPFFATSPCVLYHGNRWRMWYVSCTGWQEVLGRWEPTYHVKHADSEDGFSWRVIGISCVDAGEGYSVARPCVFHDGANYGMIYPFRKVAGYRTEKESAYRLGYANSTDGIAWQRRDELVGIVPSSAGWDSEMIEYCWLEYCRGETYLLYNGNGFGQSGFGIARLIAH